MTPSNRFPVFAIVFGIVFAAMYVIAV